MKSFAIDLQRTGLDGRSRYNRLQCGDRRTWISELHQSPSSADHAAAGAETPLVSVVTVFYNRQDSVAESVGSLCTQTCASFEIICVDDGSTDDTLAKMRAIDDPRLHVMHHENCGFTTSIARGVASARGRYIAIHGAGDVSLPDRLAKQAEVLDRRPEIGAVGCYVADLLPDGDTMIFKPRDDAPLSDILARENPFTHGEVMFRRSIYDQAGGYRSAFAYAQDKDLWWRMSRYTDHAVIRDVLYRRGAFADSVSADPLRLARRYLLTDLADQIAKRSRAGGEDLVDAHGSLAFYYKAPSRALADQLARLSLMLISLGRTESVPTLLRISRNEKITRLVVMAHVQHLLWRVSGIPRRLS